MPTIPSLAVWPARGRVLFPGLLACGVVTAAAGFLSEHYGAPEMLFALLLGMTMNYLASQGPCAPGIEFTARTLSRVGIALLGLRITLDEMADSAGRRSCSRWSPSLPRSRFRSSPHGHWATRICSGC